MKISMIPFLGFTVFFLLLNLASSTFISDGVFASHISTGRTLLQAEKNCPIDFEKQNYTIITSRCKGPRYTADLCCNALRDFACPFAEEINDMSTNCATTMFSYINLYGKYPPGIFSNMCKGDKHGLRCSDDQPRHDEVSKESKQINMAHTGNTISSMLPLLATFLVFLYCLP